MITDTEIRVKVMQILAKHLGDVEAERFIALIQREPFDYTKQRKGLDEDLSIEDISEKAMALRMKNTEQVGPVDKGNSRPIEKQLKLISSCLLAVFVYGSDN